MDHDFTNSTPPVVYVCGTGARQPIEYYLKVITCKLKVSEYTVDYDFYATF